MTSNVLITNVTHITIKINEQNKFRASGCYFDHNALKIFPPLITKGFPKLVIQSVQNNKEEGPEGRDHVIKEVPWPSRISPTPRVGNTQ